MSHTAINKDLETIRLDSKSSLLYNETFLKNAEAGELFEKLINDVPWKQEHIKIQGKQIPLPRLTAWYGDKEASYNYSGIKNTPTPWNPVLRDLKERVEAKCESFFNSVLLNWYRIGSDSIGWHADDERELGHNPTIASISLGQVRTFSLRSNLDGKIVEIDLQNGSLLVMNGKTQKNWKHSVQKQRHLTGQRVNLTFRYIHHT